MSLQQVMLIAAMLIVSGCGPPKLPRTIPPIAAASAPAQDPLPNCVRSWPEVRFRNHGYDHIVHLSSHCSRTSSCRVSTDVSPTGVVVAVAPGEHVEVLTFRGSPAREFKYMVQCSESTR